MLQQKRKSEILIWNIDILTFCIKPDPLSTFWVRFSVDGYLRLHFFKSRPYYGKNGAPGDKVPGVIYVREMTSRTTNSSYTWTRNVLRTPAEPENNVFDSFWSDSNPTWATVDFLVSNSNRNQARRIMWGHDRSPLETLVLKYHCTPGSSPLSIQSNLD